MERQKHSALGVASFITSVVSGVLIFAIIVTAGIMEASTPGGMDEESVKVVIIGFSVVAMLGASFVAFGLGIGGLFQKDKKKIFAVLGTVFSAITILGTISIMMIGIAAS